MKAKSILGVAGILSALAVMLALTPMALATSHPTEQDFFGTVQSVGEGSFQVTTEDGEQEVVVTDQTRIRLPLRPRAGLADLAEGDRVAVSLEEVDGQLVAAIVFLIPGKTLHRQVPGLVTRLSDTEIVLQPPAEGAEPISFSRTTDTPVLTHRGTLELAEGTFVVVAAQRDLTTGELVRVAREIHVIPGRARATSEPEEADEEEPKPGNEAEVEGTFEGLSSEGGWLIGGTVVAIDANTVVETALKVGQVVKVEARLLPDGSLLAVSAKAKEKGGKVARMTHLEGIFEGRSPQGRWIVSGTEVEVGPATDTDGLPHLGQRVKVKALLGTDGSLIAREIENKGGTRGRERHEEKVKLEGILERIEGGNWVVNGVKVAVGALTRLKGTPVVGSRVEVEAVLLEDGSYQAEDIEGAEELHGRSKREARIRGRIERIEEDGTLVVNGVRVALSVLTELDEEPRVGLSVDIKAALGPQGALTASEVEIEDEERDSQRDKASFEGTVQKVNEDGSLVVNGLTIVIENAQVKGLVVEGVRVQVKGLLREDGSVVARIVRAEGAGRQVRPTQALTPVRPGLAIARAALERNEIKLRGLIESVELGEHGEVRAVVVRGLRVAIEALSRIQARLEPGTHVQIEGVLRDGKLLAAHIEHEDEEEEEAGEAEVKLKGLVEAIRRNREGHILTITVHGVEVTVTPFTEIEGSLAEGEAVEIKASLIRGVLVALELEREHDGEEEADHADEDEGHGEVRVTALSGERATDESRATAADGGEEAQHGSDATTDDEAVHQASDVSEASTDEEGSDGSGESHGGGEHGEESSVEEAQPSDDSSGTGSGGSVSP